MEPKKILIVEDDADISAIERDYLELGGYVVTIAPDGTTGLDAALHQPFDLLLLDVMLPGVDGFTICKQVRAEKDIPILMVTARGEDVDKMRNAAQKAKDLAPDLLIAGEMQFDAAVSPRVARTKCPGDPIAGSANTFIFPDINAGNIGYKIAQRLGGFDAYGPIMLGLNAPINDLSRGCNASEVYSMAIVTAALA